MMPQCKIILEAWLWCLLLSDVINDGQARKQRDGLITVMGRGQERGMDGEMEKGEIISIGWPAFGL